MAFCGCPDFSHVHSLDTAHRVPARRRWRYPFCNLCWQMISHGRSGSEASLPSPAARRLSARRAASWPSGNGTSSWCPRNTRQCCSSRARSWQRCRTPTWRRREGVGRPRSGIIRCSSTTRLCHPEIVAVSHSEALTQSCCESSVSSAASSLWHRMVSHAFSYCSMPTSAEVFSLAPRSDAAFAVTFCTSHRHGVTVTLAQVEAAHKRCFEGSPITLDELRWGVGTAQSRWEVAVVSRSVPTERSHAKFTHKLGCRRLGCARQPQGWLER